MCAGLAACTSLRSGDSAPAASELTAVPFFPQDIHQCGPAALATALSASGISITPEALTPQVYLPDRQGSLQTELIAAARQYGRLPYVIDESLSAIAAEVAAGRPVLVLQNLGVRWLPRWHYAVVVGITDDRVILRSGRTERMQSRISTFTRTWNYADRWAIVLLKPGEMPVAPDPARWIAANAAFESVGQAPAARINYEAATRVWPDDSLVWFAYGNAEYRVGNREAAEAAYRRSADLDDHNAAALNNLAQTLADRGCRTQAREILQHAKTLAPAELLQSIEATVKELDTENGASKDPTSCRTR